MAGEAQTPQLRAPFLRGASERWARPTLCATVTVYLQDASGFARLDGALRMPRLNDPPSLNPSSRTTIRPMDRGPPASSERAFACADLKADRENSTVANKLFGPENPGLMAGRSGPSVVAGLRFAASHFAAIDAALRARRS